MATLRTDQPGLCVQLSPEEAERFFESPATRAILRDVLARTARNGQEVSFLHPRGYTMDRFTVLETTAGRKVQRDGRKLAVVL